MTDRAVFNLCIMQTLGLSNSEDTIGSLEQFAFLSSEEDSSSLPH